RRVSTASRATALSRSATCSRRRSRSRCAPAWIATRSAALPTIAASAIIRTEGGLTMSTEQNPSRRQFLRATAAASTGLALAESVVAQQRQEGSGIPTRPLGKTGVRVSIVCLGGWHIGAAAKESGEAEAIRIMHRALDEGVSFWDNAWDYHDGYSEEV